MKKLKLTKISKKVINTKQMSAIMGGNMPPDNCNGCLCNTDVQGESEHNYSLDDGTNQ